MTSDIQPMQSSKTTILSNPELALALKEALTTDGIYTWGEEMTDDIFIEPQTVDLDENEGSSIMPLDEISSSSTADGDKLQEWIKSVEKLYGDAKSGEVENNGLQSPVYLNHKFPLHYASAEGNIEALEYLVSEFDINTRDKLDSTPLHVAVINNQQEAIEFLVTQGANINALAYDDYSPLSLAIHQQNFDIINYLISCDNIDIDDTALWLTFDELLLFAIENFDDNDVAKFQNVLHLVEDMAKKMDVAIYEEYNYNFSTDEFITNSLPISLILELTAAETKNPQLTDMLMQSVRNIQSFDSSHEIFIATKLLTHIFALEGGFEIYYPVQSSEDEKNYYTSGIDAEGLFGIYTVEATKQYIELYIDKNSENLSAIQLKGFEHLQKTLSQSLSLAQTSRNDIVLNDLFEQFQQSETILIPTGWEGHFVVNILDGKNGYFVTSNTGQSYQNLDSGSIIYKMHHPEKITPELLEKIANNEEQFDLEYDLFYQLGLEEVAVLPAPHQTVGNCGWRSLEVAVEAFTYLELIGDGYESHDAANLAHQWYQEWFYFTKELFLADFFENNQNVAPALIDTLAQQHPEFFSDASEDSNQSIDIMVDNFEHQLLITECETAEKHEQEIVLEDILSFEQGDSHHLFSDPAPIIMPVSVVEHDCMEQPFLIEVM